MVQPLSFAGRQWMTSERLKSMKDLRMKLRLIVIDTHHFHSSHWPSCNSALESSYLTSDLTLASGQLRELLVEVEDEDACQEVF